MYPETDVRPVQITSKHLRKIKKNMPETLENKAIRFEKELELSPDLAQQVSRSVNVSIFEKLVTDTNVSPTLIAVTLENTLVNLHRDGVDIDILTDSHYLNVFKSVEAGETSADAIPDLLKYLTKNPKSSVSDALTKMGLGKVNDEEIRGIIKGVVSSRKSFIQEQGERAVGGLMGVAMKELRGKADGKLVRSILLEEIKKVLE
jgi:glutamyl-tRNA(Gln) amidotransferase subunit E